MRFFRSATVSCAAMWMAVAGCGGSETSTTSSSVSSSTGSSSSASGTGGAGPSGSSSTGAGGMGQGGGGSAAEQFCNSVGPAFCDAIFACCADPTSLMQLGGTAAACKAMLAGSACVSHFGNLLEDSLASGQTELDKMQVEACVTRLKSLSGGAACVEPPQPLVLSDCFTAFRGQVPADAACTWAPETNSYAQCKDGLCRDAKCVAFLKTGDACDPSPGATALCNFTRGEWCKATGATGTCGPRGAIGDACGSKGMMTAECRSWNCGQDGKCAAPTPASACMGG